MPNIKSAIKRSESSVRKATFNKNQKSALKTVIKKSEIALEASAENVAEVIKKAQIKLDQAVSKGLIHKNKAANKKAQLAHRLNSLK